MDGFQGHGEKLAILQSTSIFIEKECWFVVSKAQEILAIRMGKFLRPSSTDCLCFGDIAHEVFLSHLRVDSEN